MGCSSVPSEKKPNARSQHFPSPWSGRVQTQSCKQAEKIFVLAAGTPRISRLALERLGGGRKKQWQVNEPIRVALAVAAIADPLKTFDFVVDKVSAIKL